MKRKLLLIGGGGHCHSVLDSALAMGAFDEVGIIDNVDCSCLGVSVIGTDNDIPALIKDGWNCAIITVGSVGNTAIRRKLHEMVRSYGLFISSIIDPSATIAQGVTIHDGCFIGKRAIVNTGSEIGECAIINTGAIVEHDCTIGAFSHISPGTVLCGQISVGDDSHIGAGSVVRQCITVGNNVLIGAGSVVVDNIQDRVKAYGNPCRVVE